MAVNSRGVPFDWCRESLVVRDPRHPDLSRALMECQPDDEMVAGNVEAKVRKSEGANLTETAFASPVDVCRTESIAKRYVFVLRRARRPLRFPSVPDRPLQHFSV